MEKFFDLKTLITVLIALILFKFLDKFFLDKTVEKMLNKKEAYENYEALDDYDDDDE